MESNPISKEQYEKLKIQVDILQKFLTKTFGSSFIEFCKDAQVSMTKVSTSKPLPPLNKAQPGNLNSSAQTNGKAKSQISSNIGTTITANGVSKTFPPVTTARRPPPLLHRPNVKLEPRASSSSANAYPKTSTIVIETEEDTEQDQAVYYDEGNDDVVQFLQPETVFSDDEHQGSNGAPVKAQRSQNTSRNGVKRDHSVAFDYDADEDQSEMNLPEGTECIVVESDGTEEQGQHENYIYKQDDEFYEDADGANDELYDDEDYSYNMVDDGVEVTAEGNNGNYQVEELKTDGNVTFGTVYTDPSTGMQYFQCSFCPSAKVFKHKQSLKEHYLLNHSPTPPAFQCQCGRRFLKQSQLKRHEVVHTSERPYVCPICNKDFTRKDNMTVHMVRNHAEKKHPCPYCPDKVYATPAEVNRHLRMYHSQWQQ